MGKLQKYILIIACFLILLLISLMLLRQQWNTRRLIASLEIAEPLRIIPAFENSFDMTAYARNGMVMAYITNNTDHMFSFGVHSSVLEFFDGENWRRVPRKYDLHISDLAVHFAPGKIPLSIRLDSFHPFEVSGLYRFRFNPILWWFDENYLYHFFFESEALADTIVPAPPYLSPSDIHHDIVAEFYMCFRPRIFCSCSRS